MPVSRTRRYTIEDIEPAATMLKKGGLVALPTETVYGLAADAENSGAVILLFEIKQRQREQLLSVLVSGMEMVENYCQNIPPAAYALAAGPDQELEARDYSREEIFEGVKDCAEQYGVDPQLLEAFRP